MSKKKTAKKQVIDEIELSKIENGYLARYYPGDGTGYKYRHCATKDEVADVVADLLS